MYSNKPAMRGEQLVVPKRDFQQTDKPFLCHGGCCPGDNMVSHVRGICPLCNIDHVVLSLE